MKYESKTIKMYHDLMITSCVLICIGGLFLSFVLSREYHSYTFTYGGYYSTNATLLISYLLATALIAATDYSVCQVTCEFFNNVYIIKNKLVDESTLASKDTGKTEVKENADKEVKSQEENTAEFVEGECYEKV